MISPKHSCTFAKRPAGLSHCTRFLGLMAIACILSSQTACLFRRQAKAKAVPAPPAVVRVALLPFNIPAENKDSQWQALAAPLVMARTAENLQAFEIVPVWQSYPIAVEALGASRSITPEIAAYVANRVGAKWATNGELVPAKGGTWMRLDFIPAKAGQVAFRFEKTGHIDSMGSSFHEAFAQFARYLVLPPLPKPTGKGIGASSVRELAEATNREYGWFMTAEPGKSDALVVDLARTDTKLARVLFDPVLYPSISPSGSKTRPAEFKPAASVGQDRPALQPVTPSIAPQAPPIPASQPAQAAQEPGKEPQPAVSRPAATPPATPAQPSSPPIILRKAKDSTKEPASETPGFKPGIPSTSSQPEQGKPAASDATASKAEKRVTSGLGISIQVDATKSREEANAKAIALAKEGYSPKIESVELPDKGTWFRIRLQGFRSREEARAAGDKLVAQKLIREYFIVP